MGSQQGCSSLTSSGKGKISQNLRTTQLPELGNSWLWSLSIRKKNLERTKETQGKRGCGDRKNKSFQPCIGSFHVTSHEHSSKTYFTASLAETKPEQMSVFHFLVLQTESAWDKLQRHLLILCHVPCPFTCPRCGLLSVHFANILEICTSSLWKQVKTQLNMDYYYYNNKNNNNFCCFYIRNINPVGKGLLTTSRRISFHVSRKEETHSEYDFLFFSHQQDKGSVAGRRFEQLQSDLAVGNSKPLQSREISMRCHEQHWLT